MSEILEHVAHLSQGIGPRPAGTEEEQQAALYIADSLQREAGLAANVEDFNCSPNHDIPRVIYFSVAFLAALLAMLVPVLGIPALILSLVAAVLFIAEQVLDKPLVGRLLNKGVSQNVVAKLQPLVTGEGQPARRRKVILVSHYDSGKVQKHLSGPVLAALPIIRWVELGALVLVPLLLLIRLLSQASGAFLVVLNVITVLASIVALLPVLSFVFSRLAPYNEGANCNAAGVAVLLEVAARISHGRAAAEEAVGQDVSMHGEDAVLASGYVPDGAQLVYDDPATQEPRVTEVSPVDRLVAAKAAVAALSGKPVSDEVNIDVSAHAAQIEESDATEQSAELMQGAREGSAEASTMNAVHPEAALAVADASVAAIDATAVTDQPAEGIVAQPHEVPSWFKSAQEKARKPKEKGVPVQRSRYSDALDAAVRESGNHFKQANDAIVSEAELRLQQMRNSIMEVKAPGFDQEPGFLPMPYPAPQSTGSSVQAESSYEGAPHEAAGVDGFLASVTARSEYQAQASMQGESQPRVAPASDLPTEAAAADRTIAFIPVAVESNLKNGLADGTPPQQTGGALSAEPGQGVTTRSAAVHGGVVQRKRRDIALPSLTGALDKAEGSVLQPAPLAGDASIDSNRMQSLAALPSIGESSQADRASLRDTLPSLSGVIRMQDAAGESSGNLADSSISQVGSFASAGATGAFAPVGDELLGDVAFDEAYVDDADDSVYEENFTETGAFAGPGYVEMPKSRASRLLGKFRFGKNKKQAEPTPQEWLNVDDDFDARTVGKARGGWESFRNDADDSMFGDQAPDAYDDQQWVDDWNDGYDPRWNGGGFSRDAFTKLIDRAKKDKGPQGAVSAQDASGDDFGALGHESSFIRPTASDPFGIADILPPQDDFEEMHAENVQRIYGFRHANINTEVWFVALGAELADNGGMKAFMAEHAEDLRGSIIVELDGLGAGKLTLVEEEGAYRSVKASSRMKRYVRKASATLGIGVGTGSMLWKDSASAHAARHGYQTMHLAGMEGVKPAYFGEACDTIEQVDEETMLTNADFVMEVLKNI